MRYSDQTIYDCNMLSRHNSRRERSIFDVFNRTQTAGGAAALEEMLVTKKNSAPEILNTQQAIRYAMDDTDRINLQLNNAEISYLQQYFRLELATHGTGFTLNPSLFYRPSRDPTYNFIRSNVIRLAIFLRGIAVRINRIKTDPPVLIRDQVNIIKNIINNERIGELISKDLSKINSAYIIKTDNFLRHHFQISFNQLLDAAYMLDAYTAAARTAIEYHLSFPGIDNTKPVEIKAAYHLLLKDPVVNDVKLEPGQSLMFLTGANMSGKSTFFRTISTIVLLAQSGFPVPATAVSMPYYDQVNIRISSGDSLAQGYSHFYSEIMAVNELLKSIAGGRRCFAVFDEIFSGTNVNDAAECMNIFLGRLARANQSLALVSSHDVRLAGDVMQDHVQYNYIETVLQEDKPLFTYRLCKGINEIRLGLILFNQLRIRG